MRMNKIILAAAGLVLAASAQADGPAKPESSVAHKEKTRYFRSRRETTP